MSQDKERDAFERRMLDFGWRNFTGDVQGEPPCWYYANADLNARWIGWREARAALATQPPAVQGEPLTELLIEAEFGSDSNESYPDFLAGVRFAERYYGIHSRGEGEKA